MAWPCGLIGSILRKERDEIPSVTISIYAEVCAAFLRKPQNRHETVRKVVEKLGGSLEGFWFAFGDYDVVPCLSDA